MYVICLDEEECGRVDYVDEELPDSEGICEGCNGLAIWHTDAYYLDVVRPRRYLLSQTKELRLEDF